MLYTLPLIVLKIMLPATLQYAVTDDMWDDVKSTLSSNDYSVTPPAQPALPEPVTLEYRSFQVTFTILKQVFRFYFDAVSFIS